MAAHLLRNEAGFIRVLLTRNAVTNAVKEVPVFCRLKIRDSSQPVRVVGIRTITTSKYVQQTEKVSSSKPAVEEEKPDKAKPEEGNAKEVLVTKTQDVEQEQVYRERYIPITRTSIVRRLLEMDTLTVSEKKIFKSFSASLDSAIVTKYYHGLLQNLKSLFDPINPDKDTVQTRSWNRQERLDNEYFLVEKLEDVNERANFHELPTEVLQQAMTEHDVNLGVTVEVNPDQFDVLKIWALGKTVPDKRPSTLQRLLHTLRIGANRAVDKHYKRVVIAIRLKKDQKLMLKAFKEVPVNSLEMLLPNPKIKMRKFDKIVFGAMTVTSLSGLLAKAVTYKAHLIVNSTLGVAAVGAILAVQGALRYSNRRSRYLGELNNFLYNKNIANNRGLLALLVDRAEDETFKEALLTYSLLLANRETPSQQAAQTQTQSGEIGGLTVEELENIVEQWIDSVTQTEVNFNSSEAIKILTELGILSEVNKRLYVLPLEAATRILPQRPHAALMKLEESDLAEGYDGFPSDRPKKQRETTSPSLLARLKFWK